VFASAEAAQHWQRAVALTAGGPTTLVVDGMSLAALYSAAEDALAAFGGSEEAARELAEEALHRLVDVDPASRAEVLARAGEVLERWGPQRGLDLLYQALAIYEQLPPSAGHVKALREFVPGSFAHTAAADNVAWLAEWSRVNGASDPELWERAASAWDALTRPHRAAYARWRQAEALLARQGGRTRAADVLQVAAAEAAEHVPLSSAIHELARRARIDLGVRPEAVSVEQTTPHRFGLTDRELAVLQLVSDGKTNSEIGAALYISRKTASVHVTNILRKLGVETRVQAAAVAERAGLLGSE
jgi:DNA-binding CsgD family transcriptional regulator